MAFTCLEQPCPEAGCPLLRGTPFSHACRKVCCLSTKKGTSECRVPLQQCARRPRSPAFVISHSARKERSVCTPPTVTSWPVGLQATAFRRSSAKPGLQKEPQLPLKCPQRDGSEAAPELCTGLKCWSLLTCFCSLLPLQAITKPWNGLGLKGTAGSLAQLPCSF